MSTLRKEETEVVSGTINSVLHNWMREVTVLDGSIHQSVQAGLDHCLCTATGEIYVEGWINPQCNRTFKLSACLLGADFQQDICSNDLPFGDRIFRERLSSAGLLSWVGPN